MRYRTEQRQITQQPVRGDENGKELNMEIGETLDGRESAICPLCGGEAEWSFLGDDITRVEVICWNCGRFEAPKNSFDEAQAEPLDREGEH